MTTRIAQLETVQNEAKELFRKKNIDYGDAFATYGTVGILVRLGDKIQRFLSITSKSVTLVEDEKLKDTLLDLHNYAAMAIMILDEDNTKPQNSVKSQPAVKKWNVTGDRGFCYERQRFLDEEGDTVHTCSCPSFAYCKQSMKTCKHINGNYDD